MNKQIIISALLFFTMLFNTSTIPVMASQADWVTETYIDESFDSGENEKFGLDVIGGEISVDSGMTGGGIQVSEGEYTRLEFSDTPVHGIISISFDYNSTTDTWFRAIVGDNVRANNVRFNNSDRGKWKHLVYTIDTVSGINSVIDNGEYVYCRFRPEVYMTSQAEFEKGCNSIEFGTNCLIDNLKVEKYIPLNEQFEKITEENIEAILDAYLKIGDIGEINPDILSYMSETDKNALFDELLKTEEVQGFRKKAIKILYKTKTNVFTAETCNMLENALILFNNEHRCIFDNKKAVVSNINSMAVPMIKDNIFYAPAAVFEKLGCRYDITAGVERGMLSKDGKSITFFAESDTVIENGTVRKAYAAPFMHEQELYIPVREAVSLLGIQVFFKNGIVILSKKDTDISSIFEEVYKYAEKYGYLKQEQNVTKDDENGLVYSFLCLEDVYIDRSRPIRSVTNYGDLWMHPDLYALLKYNCASLLTTSDSIKKAYFKIYLNKNSTKATNIPVTVDGIDYNWSEKTAIYGNMPENYVWADSIIDTELSGDLGWYTFDVTDYVKAAYDNDEPNLSFQLNASKYNFSFAAKENGAYVPELFVELYNEPTRFLAGDARALGEKSVVLYNGSSNAYVNSRLTPIDNNILVYPFEENGEMYIPKAFADEYIGAVEGGLNRNGVSYVGVRNFEKIGKYVYTDSRGMVCVSDEEKNLTAEDADNLWNYRYGLKRKAVSEPEAVPVGDVKNNNADNQRVAFENRNSEENTAALGKKFFKYIDYTDEKYAPLKPYVEAEDWNNAFKLFSSMFINHFRKTNFKDLYNLIAGYGDTTTKNMYTEANELMKGYFRIGADGELYKWGYPGEGYWSYGLTPLTNDYVNNVEGCDYWAQDGGVPANPFSFAKLLVEFTNEDNAAYLERFFEYMDDLYLNIDAIPEPDAVDDGNLKNPQSVFTEIVKLLYRFQVSCNAIAENGEGIDGKSLARFLMLIIDDYMPNVVETNRFYLQNWGFQQVAAMPIMGKILEGFKAGDYYTRVGFDYARSWKTQSFYSDGTDREQAWGYNDMMSKEWKKGIEGIEKLDLKVDENEYNNFMLLLKDMYAKRDGFLVRNVNSIGGNLAPNLWGSYEVDTITQRGMAGRGLESDKDATVLSIYDYLYNNGDEPKVLDDSQPYGGFFNIRENWSRTGQTGNLYANNKEHETDWINMNQAFHLTAFGQDLILAGNNGSYRTSHAPITIDGMYPSQPANIALGHRNLGIGTNYVNPFRTYMSDAISYMEGSYSQEWNAALGYNSSYTGDVETMLSDIGRIEYGLKTDRQISFFRDEGLWVITDLFPNEDGKSHKYCIEWNFPTAPARPVTFMANYYFPYDYKVFLADEIQIDATNNNIITQADNQANISLYQLASSALSYQNEYFASLGGYTALPALQTVKSSFLGSGAQGMITVAYPRETKDNELKSLEKLNDTKGKTLGFVAETENGSRILYKVAIDKRESFVLEEFSMTGESLSIVKKADGTINGLALGCEGLYKDGKSLSVDISDFEFVIKQGKLAEINPIYRPMNVPDIKPDVTSFSGTLTISLEHEEENVKFIYTTDGTEPKIGSATTHEYTKPFVIDKTTVVKARAVRPEVTEEQVTTSSNYESMTARAEFTKVEQKKAVEIDKSTLVNGLKYSYYEGRWKDLFNHVDDLGITLEAKKTGSSALFDISSRDIHKNNPDNSNEAEAFGYDWSGYIDIPSDGLYTFGISEEFWHRNINAGYNIAIYIDGEKWKLSQEENTAGSWTVPLSSGMHQFEVRYCDYRMDESRVHFVRSPAFVYKFDRENPVENYPYPQYSKSMTDTIWSGSVPELTITDTENNKQKLADDMLYYN